MTAIPAHLEKDHTLVAIPNGELTIGWSGWNSSYDNARRRRIIKRRIDESGFAVNTFEVNMGRLAEFGIASHNEFQNDAVIDGVCFARAFYDGTNNTGEIKAGKQVVFDTVTGKCVTGIHSSWQTNEYTVVGTSLVDYSSTESEGEDIPIKLSSIGAPGQEGTGVLLYVENRLPGRYLYQGKNIAGYFSAQIVKIKEYTSTPKRYELERTGQLVKVFHPGKRDVRPHMYVWAQKLSQDHAPEPNMYVVTTVFYE